MLKIVVPACAPRDPTERAQAALNHYHTKSRTIISRLSRFRRVAYHYGVDFTNTSQEPTHAGTVLPLQYELRPGQG